MQPPQTQINVPMANVANFCFRVDLLAAIDTQAYQVGLEGRTINLHLIGPISHAFTNERADELYIWYLNLTGQNKVVRPDAPLAFTGRPGQV